MGTQRKFEMRLVSVAVAGLLCMSTTVSAKDRQLLSAAQPERVTIADRPASLVQRIKKQLANKGPHYQPRTVHLRSDGSPEYTNRLILEDSPYLIQHAHNPVDWYPWGEEAFAQAKRENKPIFLSIGYSTCHWCHVMEKESFESPEIAEILNTHFVSIKVDRERRPDVDETYMTAVRLMSRRGGWPMSSFLTPDGKPFHGGTYFPPDHFRDLSLRVAAVWTQQRAELIAHAERVADAVAESARRNIEASEVGLQTLHKAINDALAEHDELNGGFSEAPKFPHEPLLLLLLESAERYQIDGALTAVETTLDAMARGGIHDQVGGGFHRYATDPQWLVPHFEKMLYNQAHLGRVYLLAWRLTGKSTYRRTATQVFDYVLRDLTSPNGAFYSATDADSAGSEGTFFLWTRAQLQEALPEADAALATEAFGVSKSGNFEGSNILHLPISLAEFAAKRDMRLPDLLSRLDGIREQLYQVREQREHPLRDEKIITAWNGMMITTLAQAGSLLSEPRYLRAAQQAAEFIWKHNRQGKGELRRVNLEGRSSIAAQQEDYAYFAEGLLHLYDATGTAVWLERAQEVANGMLRHFWDSDHGGFFMSRSGEQLTSMSRARDGGSDNSMPSGNSVALRVLQMLSVRTGEFEYEEHAQATLATFSGVIDRYPPGFGYMLRAADYLLHGESRGVGYAAKGGIRLTARRTKPDQIAVNVAIPAGWHINSNTPLQKGLIPTTLSVADQHRGWAVTQIGYPTAEIMELDFQQEPLSLYHGNLEIRADLEVPSSPSHILPLQVGLQACNDRVCLPPERVNLHLPMAAISDAGS